MTHYIYRIEPTRTAMLSEGPTPQEAQAVADHFAYLKRLEAEGQLFMAGRALLADERAFGIAIFSAATEQQASDILANDPAVARGVMRGAVYPFRVAIWSGDPMGAAGGD